MLTAGHRKGVQPTYKEAAPVARHIRGCVGASGTTCNPAGFALYTARLHRSVKGKYTARRAALDIARRAATPPVSPLGAVGAGHQPEWVWNHAEQRKVSHHANARRLLLFYRIT